MVVVDYVTDDDLVALYSLCKLFVLPSLHEGFGLPALEAMACGAAVIGSNTTSIPEVIGRNDAMFDPSSAHAIARIMQRALTDQAFHESLRRHGLQQAKKFSWDITARRALKAFETLRDDRRMRGELLEGAPYRRLIKAIGQRAAFCRIRISCALRTLLPRTSLRNHPGNFSLTSPSLSSGTPGQAFNA